MLSVKDWKPREVVDRWLSEAPVIRALEGCAVLLTHQEYGILENLDLELYEELVSAFVSDSDAWITTPNRVASSY